MPELFVLAGPNGVGKTSLFKEIVPSGLDYINADLIAKELRRSAGGLNTQDLANRETSHRYFEKISRNESFAIETNLCDNETYKSFIQLQARGYKINICFMSVDDVQICIDRVNMRVGLGGHFVRPDIIRERYNSSLKLLRHYRDFPDVLTLVDNSAGELSVQCKIEKGKVVSRAQDEPDWCKTIIQQSSHSKEQEGSTTARQIRERYRASRKRGKGI